MCTSAFLTQEEQYKFDSISLVIKKEIKTKQAAKMLSISTRQVRRLKNAVKSNGAAAIVHKLKGKRSNHCISEDIRRKAIAHIKEKYADFKPAFAHEKLQEYHEITVSSQTVRRWMIHEKLWISHRQKKTAEYRSWRPRREYYGELEQFDGSYHDWFEGRCRDLVGTIIETCLLVSVDDATGAITHAVFADNEGVIAVFNFWFTYVNYHGKPIAIYLDSFSTYKVNHKSAVDNFELMTQFERTAKDLNIRLITAHSPQAKGRIERLFQTLQDRLVKELRLAGINNPEDANIFLQTVFIKKFNEHFAVTAVSPQDIHRPLTDTDRDNLNRIFSIQSKRKVNNDFTIQFRNNCYQLEEIQPATIRARETVMIEEWLNGSLQVSLRGRYLNFFLLPERPKKLKTNPVILTTHKLNWKPLADHPWRQYHNR